MPSRATPRSTASPSRWPRPSLGVVDTWIFLGTLAAASALVLRAYGWAISGYTPPPPRDDLQSVERFHRDREGETEVDLGLRWLSTDDVGAQWHLWWIVQTGELVGLRTPAHPPPPGPAYYSERHLRQGQLHANLPYSGMKVLGHLEHRPSLGLCQHLRVLPNGLDVLCGGTHGEDRGEDRGGITS